ncbi:unnamed protein product [Urochloa humidicola]
MSNKRRGHDGQGQNHHADADGDKRPRRRKHLYLVLDDWDKGFSIHKIDADSFDSYDHHRGAARHLPEPPALRLESPVGPVPQTGMSFSALGKKIFTFVNQRCGLIYNTETAVLAIGAHVPAQMVCGFGITVAVGEMLYALSYRFSDKQHSFEVMSWDATQHPTEGWSWKTLPPPPPAFHGRVNSYALHPDGSTIFMTTANKGRLGTYSFSTKDSVWSWQGEWALPFLGQGHFDNDLGAWVGLHRDGYICACQVASLSCHSTTPPLQLDCQTTKEKLFGEGPERHMRASLTYVGTSKFCLVQCVAGEGVEEGQALGDHDGCVIHLTMFGLKYNNKGELQVTEHRSTRSFVVSRHKNHFGPVAFWM